LGKPAADNGLVIRFLAHWNASSSSVARGSSTPIDDPSEDLRLRRSSQTPVLALESKSASAAAPIMIERRAPRLWKSRGLSAWPTGDFGPPARLQNRSVASCPIPANSDILRCGPRRQGSNAIRPIETARFHHAARRSRVGHGDGAAASGGAGLFPPPPPPPFPFSPPGPHPSHAPPHPPAP